MRAIAKARSESREAERVRKPNDSIDDARSRPAAGRLAAYRWALLLALSVTVSCRGGDADDPPAPQPAGRSTTDRADEIAGSQLHIVYALPSDGTDRRLDTDGTLTNSIGSVQGWLSGQTGGRRLRLDTDRGAPDITFVRLSRTDAAMRVFGAFLRDSIERELATLGFSSPNKVYAVYYDGGNSHACGGGAWPPTLPGRVAALYLQGTPPGASPCSTNRFASSSSAAPGYLEFAMLHELLHTLGFVGPNAPHHALAGHTSESNTDLMYAGSQPWIPSVLDIGGDDYFGAAVPAGVPNLASSAFLTQANGVATASASIPRSSGADSSNARLLAGRGTTPRRDRR